MLKSKNIIKDENENRWYEIFDTKEKIKDEYQDILSTEDCILDSFEKLKQIEKD